MPSVFSSLKRLHLRDSIRSNALFQSFRYIIRLSWIFKIGTISVVVIILALYIMVGIFQLSCLYFLHWTQGCQWVNGEEKVVVKCDFICLYTLRCCSAVLCSWGKLFFRYENFITVTVLVSLWSVFVLGIIIICCVYRQYVNSWSWDTFVSQEIMPISNVSNHSDSCVFCFFRKLS